MATIGREAARAPLTSADINNDTITADDLVATLDLSSKTLTLGALSATGNISFGDNDKAIFGAGSDLQIYHDASDSIILDNGTGNLKIQADDLVLKSADGAKEYLKGTSGGSVRIRYNNTTVLETASTGIDVTGTVTADGLTVDGDGTLQTSDGPIFNLKSTDATLESGNVVGSITFETSDSSSAGVAAKIEALGENVTGGVGLNFSSGFGGSPVKRMTIDRNGDISFYEDTGTTPKFFWDASAESLLIGQTAIPTGLGASNTKLILGNFEDAPEFVAYNSDNAVALGDKIGAYLFGNDDNNATEDHFAGMWAKSAGSSGAMDIHFAAGKTDYENDSPHMTLSYDGNVGIGNTSMSSFYSGGQQLVVGSGTSDQGITIYAGSSDNSGIYFADSTSGDARYEGQLVYFHSSNHMGFYTSASEAMRIDSSGNVDLYQGNNLTWRYAAGSTIRGSMSIDSADNITFSNTSSNTERMRITSAGLVGIGTSSPDTLMELRAANPVLTIRDTETSTASNDARVRLAETGVSDALGNYYDIGYIQGNLQFRYNTSEYMRIDSSGNLLVGKSVTTFNTTGFLYEAGAAVEVTRSGNRVMRLNRTTNDGSILEFNKDGGTVGSIGVNGSRPYLANNVNFGIKLDDFGGGQLQPATTAGAVQDNACDLGGSSARWDDIYATNGTIQTSDANEKQDIRDLSEAEARVAQAAKALLKAFRWKDSVAEKGDDARIHFGIIAQDLQAAFEAEGLDAGRYAMFIHSTWTDEETGEERSRMGVRYSELLAFIIAAL